MTTTQIEYFLAAAQTLNFGAAADLVFTTRSSLSRQIASLEEELGAPLFTRENHVLALTSLGQEFYIRISRHYEDYMQLLYEFSQLKSGMGGHIKLGVMEYQQMDDVLIDAAERLLRSHTTAVIDMKRFGYADLIQSAMSGAIDVAQAYLYEEINIPDRDMITLGSIPCCLAIPKELCPSPKPRSIHVSDIAALKGDLPIVIRSADTYPVYAQPSMLQRIERMPAALRKDIRHVSTTDSVDLYLSMGSGVAISNGQNIFQNNPRVCLIPIDGEEFPPFEYGLMWSRKNTNPLLYQLIDLVRGILA